MESIDMEDTVGGFLMMSIGLLVCGVVFVISGLRQPRHNVEHFERLMEIFLWCLVIYMSIAFHLH
jgi:hypothetical protein